MLDQVVVVDNDRDLPASGVAYLPVPEMTVEAVLGALSRSGMCPTACFTYVDPATAVAAETASRLGLPGLAPSTAVVLKNKAQFRDRLRQLGIDSPQYHKVESEEDLENAARAVGFPCVLKPTFAAYGLGVRRIDSPEALRREFRAAAAELASSSFVRFFPLSGTPRWLLEEYFVGAELSIEVLGHPHSPTVLAVHEKTVAEDRGRFREDRFVTAPWKLSHSQLDLVREQAAHLCALLGFSRGVGNLEARLLAGDKLGVIELQTTPTGGLVSAMVRRSHGIDLHDLHARSHLQQQPITVSSPDRVQACAMEILHSARSGLFRITGAEEARASEGVFDVQILTDTGIIRDPHSENLGFVCAEASDLLSAVDRLERALDRITVSTSQGEFSPAT
jgi:biotin carboxylase